MIAFLLFLLLLQLMPGPLEAGETVRASVPAEVVNVYDGDTITVDAHPWPGLTLRTAVRLRGVDTPEIRGKCATETAAARKARDKLSELTGGGVYLENIAFDKYGGRVDADVITPGGNAAAILIEQGLGRPYAGGNRAGWCRP